MSIHYEFSDSELTVDCSNMLKKVDPHIVIRIGPPLFLPNSDIDPTLCEQLAELGPWMLSVKVQEGI